MAAALGELDLTRRDKRWNFVACLIDAVGWPLGTALISLQTIFPVFLGRLGAGNLAIGALPALYNLLLFLPGLAVAGHISRMRRARGCLFWVALAERLALVPLAGLTLLWGRTHPQWLLAAVFVCIGFHAAMMGLNQPAYWVVVGKCVPPHWRGRLFGYAGGVAGVLGLGVECLLRHFLSGPSGGFPDGYGHLFLLSFAVLTVSVLPLGVVREPDRTPVPEAPPAPNNGGAGGASADIWRTNPGFRRFLYAQIAGTLAALATPFFVLDAMRRLHGGGSVPGYTATLVLAAAFGGLAWGAWGDHGGNRRVLLAASACLALAPALAALAPSAPAYYGVFLLSALGAAGIGLAGNNIVMEYAGTARAIPHYTALYNAVTSLPRAAAPLLGGLLADRLGYASVFWLAAALAVASLLLTLRAHEPRHSSQVLTFPQEAP